MKRKNIEIALGVLGVSGAFLAIYPLKDSVDKHIGTLPEKFYLASLIIGLLLFILGVIVLLLPVSTINSLLNRLRRALDGPDFDCRPAKKNELKSIRDYSQEFFGEQVSELTKMKQWYRKNPKIFWVLIQNKSRERKKIYQMVGYYSVIPITEEARALVEQEELNGVLFTTGHIANEAQTPSAIYIGAIAANSLPFRARAILLTYLKEYLKRERERGVTMVYSRPITKRGLDLLEKYEFSPVSPYVDKELKRIYKSVIPSLPQGTAEED